jgi:hypothetical protein
MLQWCLLQLAPSLAGYILRKDAKKRQGAKKSLRLCEKK